jgi:hypothetical protein
MNSLRRTHSTCRCYRCRRRPFATTPRCLGPEHVFLAGSNRPFSKVLGMTGIQRTTVHKVGRAVTYPDDKEEDYL